MALQRLLGSRATRSVTVLSVLLEAKRAFDRNNTVRAAALLGVAALAWKWTMLGMAAQGIVKLLRGGR
ncbi:hypothetical protein [Natrialbaceae archaeon AArc-T1-2]|uniref:hypothetical protein n=1 Tax=Natrialbaceae archaeon AArc-T1-2 TaxID=3053904 RepID=UPI00255AB080|nr:hypothetical protein [Natrialbaceae archaeon AArc-T1-2]WIV67970.1 hypothetical protein QQ977_04355 [Natrialbaceae archaeon AArc-T1-2]